MRQSRHLMVTNLPDCISEDRITEHFKRYASSSSLRLSFPRCCVPSPSPHEDCLPLLPSCPLLSCRRGCSAGSRGGWLREGCARVERRVVTSVHSALGMRGRRFGKVQSVKSLSPGTATVAFIDIRSAAKAFHSPDNQFEERILKTEFYEPPASSTASSAIFIHDTREDVLPRPATLSSHNSSSSGSASTAAFASNRSTRHPLLSPARS